MRKEGLPGTHYLGNITVRATIIIAIQSAVYVYQQYSVFVVCAVHVPIRLLWKCRWAVGIPFGCWYYDRQTRDTPRGTFNIGIEIACISVEANAVGIIFKPVYEQSFLILIKFLRKGRQTMKRSLKLSFLQQIQSRKQGPKH